MCSQVQDQWLLASLGSAAARSTVMHLVATPTIARSLVRLITLLPSTPPQPPPVHYHHQHHHSSSSPPLHHHTLKTAPLHTPSPLNKSTDARSQVPSVMNMCHLASRDVHAEAYSHHHHQHNLSHLSRTHPPLPCTATCTDVTHLCRLDSTQRFEWQSHRQRPIAPTRSSPTLPRFVKTWLTVG
jgi:hypothetical protein